MLTLVDLDLFEIFMTWGGGGGLQPPSKIDKNHAKGKKLENRKKKYKE